MNSDATNKYWIECHRRIREFYPSHPIVILDDNSNTAFLDHTHILTNTIIVCSEFPGRGELLPYLYYNKYHWFDRAVILHDSAFINSYIDFSMYCDQPLWHFDSSIYHGKKRVQRIIDCMRSSRQFDDIYKQHLWSGCFGCMSLISHANVRQLNRRFGYHRLTKTILCRKDRMALERIIGVMFYELIGRSNVSILGNIMEYCQWGYSFDQFICENPNYPIIKVWTGR